MIQADKKLDVLAMLKATDAERKRAQEIARSRVETRSVSPAFVNEVMRWRPEFQRPLTMNNKVRALIETMRRTKVIPGVVTLGLLNDAVYLIDGQHRFQAFLLTELPEAYVDVRYLTVASMQEMAQRYREANSQLVRHRVDDLLRAAEVAGNAHLAKIRERCPFVGYAQLRRNARSPILAMSMLMRVWHTSQSETPNHYFNSTEDCARLLNDEETDLLIGFLTLCDEAWGRDLEYDSLWQALNLTLVAWLYRRVVIREDVPSRVTRLQPAQFQQGLRALSSTSSYIDWLHNRRLGERERAPTYRRMKDIFTKTVIDGVTKLQLPAPEWAYGR